MCTNELMMPKRVACPPGNTVTLSTGPSVA